MPDNGRSDRRDSRDNRSNPRSKGSSAGGGGRSSGNRSGDGSRSTRDERPRRSESSGRGNSAPGRGQGRARSDDSRDRRGSGGRDTRSSRDDRPSRGDGPSRSGSRDDRSRSPRPKTGRSSHSSTDDRRPDRRRSDDRVRDDRGDGDNPCRGRTSTGRDARGEYRGRDDRSAGRSGSSRGDSRGRGVAESRGRRNSDGAEERFGQQRRSGQGRTDQGRPPRRDDQTRPRRPRDESRGPRDEDQVSRPAAPVWIDEGPTSPKRAGRGNSQSRSSNGRAPKKRQQSSSLDRRAMVDLVGETRADRLLARIDKAADAYASDRFEEARSILAPIVSEAPDFVESRELYGLTLYRLGRWKLAAQQLEAFVELSGGSTEQHPVLADCRRALKHYGQVDRLWGELKEASPSSELMTEGRIVAAGALADQGKLADAVRLLSQGFRFPKRPGDHHLRRAYALADLYERSGDLPQARMLFERIAHFDDESFDAVDRLRNLS